MCAGRGGVNHGHSHGEGGAMTQSRKVVIWALLAALATLISYFSFRGYLGPEFLLNFANSLYC
jgi:asparagine N-glycosylation enzyme membrane subunit Stt3